MKKYITTKTVMAEYITIENAVKNGLLSAENAPEPILGGMNFGYVVKDTPTSRNRWMSEEDFKAAYRCSETSLDRVNIEIGDLYKRLQRLSDLLEGKEKVKFAPTIQALLSAQKATMEDYAVLLDIRASKMKGETSIFNQTSFGGAIHLLNAGVPVRRAGWGNKALIVFKAPIKKISKRDVLNSDNITKMGKDIILKNKLTEIDCKDICLSYDLSNGVINSWSPSMEDIFSEDWEVASAI